MILTLALLSGCQVINRGHEAMLVLGDLAAGSDESRLKQRTAEPERTDLRYEVDGREYLADQYRPDDPRRGHLILVHGFTQEGRRDPRLVEFATTLSRAGELFIDPGFDNIHSSFNPSEDEVAVVVATFLNAPEGENGQGLTLPREPEQSCPGLSIGAGH